MAEPGMLKQLITQEIAKRTGQMPQMPVGMRQMTGNQRGRNGMGAMSKKTIGAGRPSNAPIQRNDGNGAGMQMLRLLAQAMMPRRRSFENQPSQQAHLEELATRRNKRDRAVRDKTNPVRGEWQR